MIEIQSPTRVDLAGGTLDFWPLHAFLGECCTVNLAIDIYTRVQLKDLTTNQIQIDVQDLNYKKDFAHLDELLNSSDKELKLFQALLGYFRPKGGFYLSTASESPIGGGLGGSSSLCVSLIKAFLQREGRKLSSLEIVELAHNIEAQLLWTPTGTQDYVPAIDGGLHFIHYTLSGIKLEKMNLNMDEFAQNFFLVYTGKAHHSGINNWEVYQQVINGDTKRLETLKRIASISQKMAAALRAQKWSALPTLFDEEFSARVQLSPGFTSPEIEKLHELTKENGAESLKICGAGGGGCVLVWSDPKHHARLSEVCERNGFQPLKIRPVK